MKGRSRRTSEWNTPPPSSINLCRPKPMMRVRRRKRFGFWWNRFSVARGAMIGVAREGRRKKEEIPRACGRSSNSGLVPFNKCYEGQRPSDVYMKLYLVFSLHCLKDCFFSTYCRSDCKERHRAPRLTQPIVGKRSDRATGCRTSTWTYNLTFPRLCSLLLVRSNTSYDSRSTRIRTYKFVPMQLIEAVMKYVT